MLKQLDHSNCDVHRVELVNHFVLLMQQTGAQTNGIRRQRPVLPYEIMCAHTRSKLNATQIRLIQMEASCQDKKNKQEKESLVLDCKTMTNSTLGSTRHIPQNWQYRWVDLCESHSWCSNNSLIYQHSVLQDEPAHDVHQYMQTHKGRGIYVCQGLDYIYVIAVSEGRGVHTLVQFLQDAWLQRSGGRIVSYLCEIVGTRCLIRPLVPRLAAVPSKHNSPPILLYPSLTHLTTPESPPGSCSQAVWDQGTFCTL